MLIHRNVVKPLGDTIKLMDSNGNITEIKIADLGPCLLERYMGGVKLAQNVRLENTDESRCWILRMARINAMIFKIVE